MMKKYLVETISQHVVRYVVEAREEEHALDEVTMNCEVYSDSWKEFSQEHIGDAIVSSREVTDDEIVALFDKHNSYAIDISRERKLNCVNRIKYDDSEIVPEERDWEYDGLGNKVYKGTMRTYEK